MSEPVAPLPRRIMDGVYWLGDCLVTPFFDSTQIHACQSSFLLAGSEASVVIDPGLPRFAPTLLSQLASLESDGIPPIRYLFMTHTEVPHAGAVGHLLAEHPDAIACGDTTDLHLVFPQFADRFRRLDVGESLDLGDTKLQVVEAVFRDYVSTVWCFDSRRKILFPGDGFSYLHYHQADQCARYAEELPSLSVPESMVPFLDAAFAWTAHTDMEPYVARLEELVLRELEASFIAPTHGLPISDPTASFGMVRAGLLRSAAGETAG